MQNSQRVHDAKPRTAPMARRRDGDIAPYRQAARGVRTQRGAGGAQAKPRTAPRRGGAMGTSRPTAKPHEECARNGTAPRGTGGAHAMGPRNGTAPRGTGGAHGEGTRRGTAAGRATGRGIAEGSGIG